MSDQPENLTLILLRRIDRKVDHLGQDLIEAKERLGFLEQQYNSISRRIDPIGGDIELINKRLNLVDSKH